MKGKLLKIVVSLKVIVWLNIHRLFEWKIVVTLWEQRAKIRSLLDLGRWQKWMWQNVY